MRTQRVDLASEHAHVFGDEEEEATQDPGASDRHLRTRWSIYPKLRQRAKSGHRLNKRSPQRAVRDNERTLCRIPAASRP